MQQIGAALTQAGVFQAPLKPAATDVPATAR
jgi:hypothetical protein